MHTHRKFQKRELWWLNSQGFKYVNLNISYVTRAGANSRIFLLFMQWQTEQRPDPEHTQTHTMWVKLNFEHIHNHARSANHYRVKIRLFVLILYNLPVFTMTSPGLATITLLAVLLIFEWLNFIQTQASPPLTMRLNTYKMETFFSLKCLQILASINYFQVKKQFLC